MLEVAETNDRKMLLTTNASLKADAKWLMSNDLLGHTLGRLVREQIYRT